MRARSIAMLVVAIAAAPTVSFAEDEPAEEDPAVQEAHALFDRGRELAGARRFEEAAEAFEGSYALLERPSTAFNLALCHYALGRHVEAIEVLERYHEQANPEEEGDAYRDAMEMLEHARASVGAILIEIAPVEAYVSVDGEALTGGATRRVMVNPGMHVVRAQAPYHREAMLELAVARGETVRRALALVDARTPADLTVSVDGVPDAAIEIDGEAVGRGRAHVQLDAGEHAVRVTHPTLRPHERTVTLGWGERASILFDPRATPVERSIAEEPGLWLGLAGAALAVAGGILLGWFLTQPNEPNGGSTGVVLAPQRSAMPQIAF